MPADVVVPQRQAARPVGPGNRPAAPAAKVVAEPSPQAAAVEEIPTAKKPPPFLIRSPSREDRLIKMLVYGIPGVGKTTFGASADDVPSMQDVFFVDAEQGDKSIEDRAGLSIVGVDTYDQFSHIYEYLRLHCRYRDENNVAELIKTESWLRQTEVTKPHRYHTVVVDSLTQVNKLLLYKVRGIKVGTTKLSETLTPTQLQEWGQASDSMRLLIQYFRNLPMNVIFICQEQSVEDENKRQHKRPELTGKMANEVMGFMDFVGYMATATGQDGEERRRLFIQPGRTFAAKARIVGNTTKHIDNPDLSALLEVSRAGK